MSGYIKRFLRTDKLHDQNGNLVDGEVWSVDFYLAGGEVIDCDQKFFVKEGDDVDKVLSKAYYEKQLSLIKKRSLSTPQSSSVDGLQEPLAFTKFKSDPDFKEESKETIDMLKSGEMPDVGNVVMNGGVQETK